MTVGDLLAYLPIKGLISFEFFLNIQIIGKAKRFPISRTSLWDYCVKMSRLWIVTFTRDDLLWKAILVKYCLNANRAIMNAWIHIFIWITWSTNFKSKFVCHFRPKNRRNPSLHQARDSNHDCLSCAWICRRSWHPRTHYLRFWWSRTHGNGNYLWSWSFLEYTQILTQTLSWSFIQPN